MTEVTETVSEATEAEQTGPTAEEIAAQEAAIDASFQLFTAACNSALEEADTSTGTIPEAHLEPVKTTYRALEGGAKVKKRAKDFVSDSMKAVLSAAVLEDMWKAVSWNSISEAISTVPKTTAAPKATVSPNKAHADRVQALRLALDLVEGAELPEGVTESWEEDIDNADTVETATAYKAWLDSDAEDKGDEPQVSAVVKQAVKIASTRGPRKVGRPAGTRSAHVGPMRDVGKHISSAFDAVESGTFLTVSEIRNHRSEEYGADDAPSAGAINQRLRPPSGKPTTIPGITVRQGANGVWGAEKN